VEEAAGKESTDEFDERFLIMGRINSCKRVLPICIMVRIVFFFIDD
jgi:hypothetical protein